MRRGVLVTLLLFVLLLVLLAGPACGTIRAARLLEDARREPEELAAEVDETSHTVRLRGQDVSVRLLRPAGEEDPLPGVVLVHGAVDQGARDPRLVALARAIAIRGATVATPDLPSLKRFRIDEEDPARVAGTVAWLAKREGVVEDGEVALVGISVGGAYSIVAAGRGEVRDRVTAVLTFGAYPDLEDLLVRWLTDPRRGAPRLHDPLTRGRHLVIQGNLDQLVPARRDREFVADAVDALLKDRAVPSAPPGLGPRAERVLGIARSKEPVPESAVAPIIEELEGPIAAGSPARAAGVPKAPVFLLHGATDPIVPETWARDLAEDLERRGADVTLHVTDLFTHVTAEEGSPSFFDALPLLWFAAKALEAAGL